jgi:1,4-alpha-glucan branching enzyme
VTPAPGEVALVLHTHLPYVRNHGIWPVGEEWLFQAWGTSWLPVTRLLERLADDGFVDVLTLGVTPTVAHQVADPRLAADLGTWARGPDVAERGAALARLDGAGGDGPGPVPLAGLPAAARLPRGRRVPGGLRAVWAELARRGVIELLGGPATHPYLPLQTDPP